MCDTPVPEPGRYGEATMVGERKEAVVVCPDLRVERGSLLTQPPP